MSKIVTLWILIIIFMSGMYLEASTNIVEHKTTTKFIPSFDFGNTTSIFTEEQNNTLTSQKSYLLVINATQGSLQLQISHSLFIQLMSSQLLTFTNWELWVSLVSANQFFFIKGQIGYYFQVYYNHFTKMELYKT